MNSYEISKKVLEKAAFGYKTDEVDSFIIEIIAYTKKLEEENKEYDNKMSVLAEKIEDYRDQEESMKEVLLSAQRVSTQVISDARKKAETMIEEATIKSEQLARESEKTLERATLDAELNAKSILDDAKKKADEMLVGAQKQAQQEEEHLAYIQKKVSDFKAELLSTYRSHLDLITKLPSDEKPEETEEVDSKKESATTEFEKIDSKKEESKDDFSRNAEFKPSPFSNINASFSTFDSDNLEKDADKKMNSESASTFEIKDTDKNNAFEKEIEEQFKKEEAAKTRAVIQIKDTTSSKNQNARKETSNKIPINKTPLKITVKENKGSDNSSKYESKFGELDFGNNPKK